MPQRKPTLASLKSKAAEHAQKAKTIQAKIREIESERFLQIGKIIVDFQNKDWVGFDAEIIKKKVAEIINA